MGDTGTIRIRLGKEVLEYEGSGKTDTARQDVGVSGENRS